MKPVILIVTTLLALLGIWFGSFPLGVPGEWTWSRLEPPSPLLLPLVLPILVAALFIGVAWLGARRIDGASTWETMSWLAGLVVAGVVWLLTVQDVAPQPHNLSKIAWVLFYPGPSGYFTEARALSPFAPAGGEVFLREVQGERLFAIERDYLRDYESKMTHGDVLHIGTHPPGLIMAYRGLIRLCDASPALVNLLHATQPDSVREMLDVIAEHERMRSQPTPFTRHDAAVLWLAGLLVHGLAALTVVPLFWLVRQNYSARTAWLAASLWPTVPALAVFLPKSDAMLPVLAIGFLALWSPGCWSPAFRRTAGVDSSDGRLKAGLQLVFAGVVLWLGMFISLAMLPIVFLAGLLTLWEGWLCRAEDRVATPARRLLIGLTCAGAGFLIPIALLYVTTGMNLFAVWAWNLHNHAAFYSQFPRTYWKWLLVNPIELTVAAGVPLVVLAIVASCRPRSTWRRRDCGPIWACLTTWIVLWLSGKNMGEAARLWIIIMPWFVWQAARAFDVGRVEEVGCAERSESHQISRHGDAETRRRGARPSPAFATWFTSFATGPSLWLLVLILQFAITLSIVLNVGGFEVPGTP